MPQITIQVLEGLERGRRFQDLELPIRIGREDENEIRLNDERVSRFHAKIQNDGEQVIITDLESTNGTRVNGSPVHIRVLRPGDLVTIGRCLLLFGSADEIREQRRLAGPGHYSGSDHTVASGGGGTRVPDWPGDDDASSTGDPIPETDLFPHGPPQLPTNLGPGQKAQVSDLLAYLHEKLGRVLIRGGEAKAAELVSDSEPRGDRVLPWERWQDLVDLHRELAEYLRGIAEPS